MADLDPNIANPVIDDHMFILSPSEQSDMRSLSEMHKNAQTHKERAELEELARELLKNNGKLKDVSGSNIYVIVAKMIGTTVYDVQNRRAFIYSKSEFVWTLVDEYKISLSAIKSMIKEAKKRSVLDKRPIDDHLREVYDDIASNAKVRNDKGGRTTFYKSEVTKKHFLKKAWSDVNGAVRNIVIKEMSGLDPIFHDTILRDLDLDLKVLLQQYRSRISATAKNGIPIEDKVLKRKFTSALSNLDLPKPGRAVTQEYATKIRREFRRKLADHHPDRCSDSNQVKKDHIKARFQEMQEVYQIVEDYLASHGVQAALK